MSSVTDRLQRVRRRRRANWRRWLSSERRRRSPGTASVVRCFHGDPSRAGRAWPGAAHRSERGFREDCIQILAPGRRYPARPTNALIIPDAIDASMRGNARKMRSVGAGDFRASPP